MFYDNTIQGYTTLTLPCWGVTEENIESVSFSQLNHRGFVRVEIFFVHAEKKKNTSIPNKQLLWIKAELLQAAFAGLV